MPNCKINGSLAPYEELDTYEWTAKKIRHLYNRIGNGASLEDIDNALTQTPTDLVNTLIEEAFAVPPLDATVFPWGFMPKTRNDDPERNKKFHQLTFDFVGGLIHTPVQYKLMLFWHNHFVVEVPEVGVVTYIFLYYQRIQQYAFGNFKEFVKQIGLTPYMLLYLSGNANVATQPNENYARELLELFTLGKGAGSGTYTQEDIEAIARGLTGWKAPTLDHEIADFPKMPEDTSFDKSDHDWSNITLFQEFLRQETIPADDDEAKALAYTRYEWIIKKIFEKKEAIIAEFICSKLYQYYVYETVDEAIIKEMANTFVANNWEIVPVLKQLFASQHFFDENALGAKIQSPLEYFAGFYKKTGLERNEHWFHVSWANDPEYDPDHPYDILDAYTPSNTNHANLIRRDSSQIAQQVFLPPSVAGWPGGRSWINEFTLTQRWDLLKQHLEIHLKVIKDEVLVDNYYRYFLRELSNDSRDPEEITLLVIDHYMMVKPSEIAIQGAIESFKTGVAQAAFDNGIWHIYFEFADVPQQFINLMVYLIRLPEFQMN